MEPVVHNSKRKTEVEGKKKRRKKRRDDANGFEVDDAGKRSRRKKSRSSENTDKESGEHKKKRKKRVALRKSKLVDAAEKEHKTEKRKKHRHHKKSSKKNKIVKKVTRFAEPEMDEEVAAEKAPSEFKRTLIPRYSIAVTANNEGALREMLGKKSMSDKLGDDIKGGQKNAVDVLAVASKEPEQLRDQGVIYSSLPACLDNLRTVRANSVVILDNGSSHIKTGLAGEEFPRTLTPPFVGMTDKGDFLVGDDAFKAEGVRPIPAIDPKKEVDWHRLKRVWKHIFAELKSPIENHCLIVTELPQMTKAVQFRMIEILFEEFKVPAMYIANPAVVALNAIGLQNGLVVDIGNRLQIMPVVNNSAIEIAANKTFEFMNLTEHLARLMTQRGYYYDQNPSQMEFVRKIKEKLCYVAYDPLDEAEKKEKKLEKKYKWDVDGFEKSITLGYERFQCPEALFNPSLLGLEAKGIHELIYECIEKVPIDYRKELLSNIVLIGGGTLFKGFAKRLKKELVLCAHGNVTKNDIRIWDEPARKYLTFKGCSVLGNLDEFYQKVLWDYEYAEMGQEAMERFFQRTSVL